MLGQTRRILVAALFRFKAVRVGDTGQSPTGLMARRSASAQTLEFFSERGGE